MDQQEQLLEVAYSYIYAVFGFGTDPMDFAARVLQLRRDEPECSVMLHDIADRVSLIDFLRLEVGWEAERIADWGENLRVASHLDALETYLLCTCIDALAGGRQPPSPTEWLKHNPQEGRKAFGDRASITLEEFLGSADRLLHLYESSCEGPTKAFAGFFQSLPQFVQDIIVDSLVLIEGDWLSKTAPRQFAKWSALPKEKKLRRIAVDYLYAVRRCEYTHRAHIEESAKPGHWRRLSETGILPPDSFTRGWSYSQLRATKNPDRVRYTLISRNSADENLLLRVVIATHVLTKFLHYPVSEEYARVLLVHHASVSATFAFLREMECNRQHLDYLTSIPAIASSSAYQHCEVPLFLARSGEQLLGAFGEVVGALRSEIQGYLHWLKELNGKIEAFNAKSTEKKADWNERHNDVAQLSRRLAGSYEARQAYSSHEWVYPNLKRLVKEGQIHHRHTRPAASEGPVVPRA